jgi:tRNA-uridine 2-sulfurtransferase
VTLELWADPRTDGTKSCCSPQAVIHARALAHRMGLPHVTLDARDAFKQLVVDDYVEQHEAGRTPNPCVRCNGHVRFDAMLELAERLGAKRLATGHYARIARDAHGPLLRAGADRRKDQSYMLARLDPRELERLWFPLGELAKPEVRDRARAARLPVAEKPESQDLCFLSGTSLDQFVESGSGDIVDESGRTLRRHDGQHRFTVGQRRGIGVAAAEPLYVLRKHESRVVVGPKRSLATTSVSVAGAMLLRDASEVDSVKLRYRSRPVACTIQGDPPAGRHRTLTLELDEPAHGVAPGQTACLMRGDAVIGFASIAPPRTMPAPTPTPEMELSYAR